MKKNFTKLFSIGLICLSLYAFGQQKPITGKVTDSSNFPVQDAYVYVEGSEKGVYTDENGNYTIEAQPGDKVMVEFIGFDTKNITVTNNVSNYDVKLEKGGEIKLKAVITTGYNTGSADAYTGSADVIPSDNIENKSTSNITNALAGESAGVRVISSSGQPGSIGEINIRGIGSINGNKRPLYVVDGIPFTVNPDGSNDVASINPNDVASITILKDATATAIYGSRGANGVVVITTKQGKSGKSVIEYQTKVGINTNLIPRYEVIQSPEEYAELAWRSLKGFAEFNGKVANPSAWASENLFGGKYGINENYNMWDQSGVNLIDPTTGKIHPNVTRRYTPSGWSNELFKPGLRHEHNLKFSGGFDRTNFYTSLGYLKDEGNIMNSDYERLSTRLNLDHQLNSWLSGNINVGYTYTNSNQNTLRYTSTNIFYFADNAPAIFPVYLRDKNGNKIPDHIFGGYQFDYGQIYKRPFSLGGNPGGDAKYNLNNTKTNEINLSTSVNIKFTDYLSFENRFGSQFGLYKLDRITNPFYGADTGQNGLVAKVKDDKLSYNLLQMLKFNKNFGEHSINTLAAHEVNWYRYNTLYGRKNNIVVSDLPEFDNAAIYNALGSYNEAFTIESYFGQLEYGYAKKYLLSASVRRDGSSRFVNNKWGTFGAIGAGWVVSKEDFMANQHIFDYLKLKGSYGLTGEQAGLSYYPGYNLLQISVINGNTLSVNNKVVGNPDLTWQTSKMLQFGTEMRFFNNRFSLNLDYYDKRTGNMLFDKSLDISSGEGRLKVNDGELMNSGIEFDLGIKALKTDNYYLDFNINGEIINNEITKMTIDETTGKPKTFDSQGIYGRAKGYSIYDFFLREWAGVDKTNGRAQWILYYNDKNDNGKFDEKENIDNLTTFLEENKNANIKQTLTYDYGQATRKFIEKSSIPKIRGAFSVKTGYKNWSFSAQFLYSLGGYSYDWSYSELMGNESIGSSNWHKDMLNSWTKENPNTDVPVLSNAFSGQDTANNDSTRFLTKNDYLALNNVNLKYTFSDITAEQMGIQGLSIYMSGDNLMLFSARKGFNPTTSADGSSDRLTYSPLSTISLGLNVKF